MTWGDFRTLFPITLIQYLNCILLTHAEARVDAQSIYTLTAVIAMTAGRPHASVTES